MAPDLLVLATGESRLSGLLAFLVCFIGHQVLLFVIGRWTIDFEAWRALAATSMGVAGLSIGSVTLPGLWAPGLAALMASIIMLYVYEMEQWQRAVMAAGWYAMGLGSLALAAMLFGEGASSQPDRPPPDKEALLEFLRKPANEDEEESPPAPKTAPDPNPPPPRGEGDPE